jgi:hypothetical protein
MSMDRIKIKTKIDITQTDVRHPDQGDNKQLNQYRNYTTFLQVLGIRSVFSILEQPVNDKGEWTMVIETDRSDVFSDGSDPVGLLMGDLDNVPIIAGLDEKVKLSKPLIKTKGTNANTFVTVLR